MEGSRGKDPDWEDLYFRCKKYWGNDPDFSRDNFASLPVSYILQAVEHGSKLKTEELHQLELGTATLTSCFVNANRDPSKGQPAKPSDFCYFKTDDKDATIPGVAADTFFHLIKLDLLPHWAMDLAPMDKLQAAKTQGRNIPQFYALVGHRILLICPTVSNGRLYAKFALVDGIKGRVTVRSPEPDPKAPGANKNYVIELPDKDRRWVLKFEAPIVG